ncbi:transporter [Roseibium aquae]|uniref:Transporter n=1 Tax=Roseibium aquae TaxID=1323746 RepID=A0A916X220_9HYPH|nr:ACT domain-containing protein [Roseibium aquae]GGB58523.1 transporter [Roseibium aquae]
MRGETDLAKLVSGMRPVLDPKDYVFGTFPENALTDVAVHGPLGLFLEAEGVTAILPLDVALKLAADRSPDLGLDVSRTFRRITLTVHSSLEAVGLTAAVSRALADAGIPANVVAAYFHDHVFVPAEDADRAMEVLLQLSLGSVDIA